MKAYDMITGKYYDVEVTRETKCYYVGNIINYKSQFRYSFRVHKNTMEIDYMHLIFIKDVELENY